MIFKKCNKKISVLSLLISLLLLINMFASVSVSKNVSSSINQIEDSEYFFIKNNSEEWFDGSFQGRWGKQKDCLDGEIRGNINLGRRSSVGYFVGNWDSFDNKSYGSFKGRFRNHFLIGSVSTNKDEKSYFMGLLNFNDTNFNAIIFGLKIKISFIYGEYEASFMPKLSGPYGVGVKDMHLIDESRLEEFTPDDPYDFREMMVRLWYPIDKEIKEPRVDYMDQPTFSWLMGRSPIPLITIPKNAYLFVRPHGKDVIPISDAEEMYPVIIFSPGYNGVYQIYTSLIEDIVSNGFIVASINHPYISGITVFPDGREVYVAQGYPGNLSIRSVVEDAKFVLDEITEMNISSPDFKGRFDLSKVGMYGHSFGGASTAICCYEDDRFLCGITLDGVFYLDYTPEGLDKPFMLMIAEQSYDLFNAPEIWIKLNGDAYKVIINGSTHYCFTDVGILLKHFVPFIPIRLLMFGTIEPKRHVNITKAFELVFFEVYLKGRPVVDLIALGSEYDDVQFEFK